MNETEIWNALVELSKSQGFYGRLCRELLATGKKDEFCRELAAQGVKDAVDLVLKIEE